MMPTETNNDHGQKKQIQFQEVKVSVDTYPSIPDDSSDDMDEDLYFRCRSEYIGRKAEDLRNFAFRNQLSSGKQIDLVLVAEMPKSKGEPMVGKTDKLDPSKSTLDFLFDDDRKVTLPYDELKALNSKRGTFRMHRAIRYLYQQGYWSERHMHTTSEKIMKERLSQKLEALGFDDDDIEQQIERMHFEQTLADAGFEIERVESCVNLNLPDDPADIPEGGDEYMFTLIHATDEIIRRKAEEMHWLAEIQPERVAQMTKPEWKSETERPDWPKQPQDYQDLDNLQYYPDDQGYQIQQFFRKVVRCFRFPQNLVGTNLDAFRSTETVLRSSPTTTPTSDGGDNNDASPEKSTDVNSSNTKSLNGIHNTPGEVTKLPGNGDNTVYKVVHLNQAKYFVQYVQRFREADPASSPFVLDHKSPRTVLCPADVSFFTWDVLVSADDDGCDSGKISCDDDDALTIHGIQDLLSRQRYADAFLLHDGWNPKHQNKYSGRRQGGERNAIDSLWCGYKNIFKTAPLDRVRDYIGLKWASYFLFLEDYAASLVLPAILGLLVFMVGVGSAYDYGDADGYIARVIDECEQATCVEMPTIYNTSVMCPPPDEILPGAVSAEQSYNYSKWCLCGIRPEFKRTCLADVCDSKRWSSLFNNEITLVFAVVMAVWSVAFLEKWARTKNLYTFRWHINYDTKNVRQNPFFVPNGLRPNFKTGGVNLVSTSKKALLRNLASRLIMMASIGIICAVYIFIIVFKNWLQLFLMRRYPNNYQLASMGAMLTATLLNTIVIVILNGVFKKVAKRLTEWENHRKIHNHIAAYTFKVFSLQFVNSNFILFYKAVMKPAFNGMDRESTESSGEAFSTFPEQCDPFFGCGMETTIQLASLLIVKPWVQNLLESNLPRILVWVTSMKNRVSMGYRTLCCCCSRKKVVDEKQLSKHCDSCWTGIKSKLASHSEGQGDLEWMPWEEDFFDLAQQPPNDTFDDYTELALQYGFLTMFISSFSLGPLIALIQNIFEKKMDTTKTTRMFRRSIPWHISGMGTWDKIFMFYCYIGILIQALVLCMSWPPLDVLTSLTMRGELRGNEDAIDVNYLFEDSQQNASLLEMRYAFDFRDKWQCLFESTVEDRPVDHISATGFHSNDIPTRFTGLDMQYRLWFLIVFMWVLYILKRLTALFIEEMPRSVRRHQQLREFVSNKILNGEKLSFKHTVKARRASVIKTVLGNAMANIDLSPRPDEALTTTSPSPSPNVNITVGGDKDTETDTHADHTTDVDTVNATNDTQQGDEEVETEEPRPHSRTKSYGNAMQTVTP
eukprot:m.239977 g.239977  ORF g.239977 m.239977 type:complete len:1296 (-) comp33754_c0_seq4:252-4139(-)